VIIALCGLAGSGKDSAAAALVARRGFVKISLADPLKRICADVFGWDRDRLWGPSARRNEPDPAWDGLTARRALQTLGTEWGRALHPDVWVRAALRTVDDMLRARHQDGCGYYPGAVVPDVRFANEVAAIRAAGGKVVRIVRHGAGLDGDAGAHVSEAGIKALDVDLELPNNGPLWLLQARACKLPELLFGGPAWTGE
jgi:hypothetical protein